MATTTYIPFLKGYFAESLEVLKICLNSIWESTTPPYDLLVFDNHSCPEVQNFLLDAHEKGLIQFLMLSDRNVGKGGAWNFIIQGAPGEVIAYSDSDIYFYPGWLERSLEIMDTFPNLGMVTARPLRSPEKYYSKTLEWAQQQDDVSVEYGKFIQWDVFSEHVLSLGISLEQAREWFASGGEWRLKYKGVTAFVSAAHFQFTMRRSVIQQFLPLEMDRPMGQVRSLDQLVNQAGYLRLTTSEPFVKHLGNKVKHSTEVYEFKSPLQESVVGKRFMDSPIIKRPLLGIYDLIFKMYFEGRN